MLIDAKVPSSTYKCLFYIPERSAKEGPNVIEFWRSWSAEIKYTNGLSSKSRW